MPAYVIALLPERSLSQKIRQLKQAAREVAGGLYLTDEPHLTLHIGNFSPLPIVYRALQSALREAHQPECTIREWMVFSNDIITKRHTVACGVEKTPELVHLQHTVVSVMNRFRDGIIERYRQIRGLGPQERENLKAYGFPFIGKIWKPHISIGSFDQRDYDAVWNLLMERCPAGLYKFTSIMFYELDQNTDHLTAVNNIFLEDNHARRDKGGSLPSQ